MQLSEFDFDLPGHLIAQEPAPRRDRSRLMIVNREAGSFEHRRFDELAGVLAPDDLLVLNDTRVFPARLTGRFEDTGGTVEVLLLKCELDSNRRWLAVVRPARRFRSGRRVVFDPADFSATVVEAAAGSPVRSLQFEGKGSFRSWLGSAGVVPLPPYIRRKPGAIDIDRYQTVYAAHSGSVAAPTAGLHFTPQLLSSLRICRLTLHVGYGTFKPITSDRIEEHSMDQETYSISGETASRIRAQLDHGNRVLAVGTTTTRALEHAAAHLGEIRAGTREADLFIYPGFKFRVISGLITNFHLPRSTLLMLVSAFGGKELIREAYAEAVRNQYRFYSYGDAMLLL